MESSIKDFLKRYQAASNTKTFSNVRPFIHPKALFRFNDGDFEGIDAVQKAFEKTWSYEVEEDLYELEGLRIIHIDETSASISYNYVWSGRVKDKPFRYEGRGTSILAKSGENFQILCEHLSS